MDLAVFTAAHEAEWLRLDDLVKRHCGLSGPEIDELVALYQQTTTHLSAVRSAGQDPVLVAALSSRVARPRAAVVGASALGWGMVGRFALISFPRLGQFGAGEPLPGLPAGHRNTARGRAQHGRSAERGHASGADHHVGGPPPGGSP